MNRLILFSAILSMLAAFPSKAQNLVNDQSFSDPTFLAFKLNLTQSVIERDTGKLFALLADNITTNDNDCHYTNNSCFKTLFQTSGETNLVWDELYELISLGFSKNKLARKNFFWRAYKGDVIFQAPAYYKYIEDENKQLVVLAKNVNIREQPGTRAKSIGVASFELLNYNNPYSGNSPTAYNNIDGELWYEVKMWDGRLGYIHEDYVSPKIKHELSVKKIDGDWKIISFYQPSPKC